MTPLELGVRISPSPESVEIVRATLRRMGFGLSEADARSLVEAVLAVEGPQLHLLVARHRGELARDHPGHR